MYRVVLLTLAIVFSVGCHVAWNSVPGRGAASGIADSDDDIDAGKPKFYVFPHAEEWNSEYWQILNDDYGIEVHGVLHSDDEISAYMSAYNKNVENQLKSIYGDDFLKVAEKKAIKQWLAEE